jgi:uncharacterized membrane protein
MTPQRWLAEQLPAWEREGLITPDAASTLRARYPVDSSQPGLAQIVMGILGALLIGTGLIAVLGYNWDAFSRPVRLLFAFLPLLLTQLFSMRVLHRGSACPDWVRECAGLLQALAAGACIALVSQIYNLEGEWPNFLFWWFLLSLPLAWALRSHAVALFYLITIAIWSVNQTDQGRPWHDSALLYPLLLLGLLPYWPGLAWRGSIAVLPVSVRWFLTVSAWVGLTSAAVAATHATGSDHFKTHLYLWTLTAAGMVLFPLTRAGIAETTGRKPQVVLGTLWLLGYGIAGTFFDQGSGILDAAAAATQVPWGRALLAVVAAFAAVAVWQRRWAVLSLASIVLLPLLVALLMPGESTALSWLCTTHLGIIGITLIVLDLTGRQGAPRLGAALFSMLVIARMADSDLSLLTKGIAFIVVGVAFLAFNIFVSRHHRRSLTPPTPPPTSTPAPPPIPA